MSCVIYQNAVQTSNSPHWWSAGRQLLSDHQDSMPYHGMPFLVPWLAKMISWQNVVWGCCGVSDFRTTIPPLVFTESQRGQAWFGNPLRGWDGTVSPTNGLFNTASPSRCLNSKHERWFLLPQLIDLKSFTKSIIIFTEHRTRKRKCPVWLRVLRMWSGTPPRSESRRISALGLCMFYRPSASDRITTCVMRISNWVMLRPSIQMVGSLSFPFL